ncbi:MAG: histidine kinase [Actinomycetota bacterium]|nr:histidine kinase [Actinomycetota bacterium]
MTGGSAGSAAPSRTQRRRPRRTDTALPDPSSDSFPLIGSDEDRGVLRTALAGVRKELGFETASVYASSPDGWRLLEREGPVRPWHGVLDPGILEGTSEVAEYSDVSAVPGVGPRLAALGCRSVAMLPLPQSTRLLLDSGTRVPSGGWIDRARPYLDLMAIMTGPAWMAAGALRNHEEVAALSRTFAACQEVLSTADARAEDLLDRVREALRADELFLVRENESTAFVMTSPGGTVRDLSPEARNWLSLVREGGFDDERLRTVAILVGASSRALAAASGREGSEHELVVAGWAEGPSLSAVSMDVAAHAVSTALAAMQTRHRAVSSVVDRERTRMAYALHDDLIQTVTGAVLELEALRKRIERDPEEAIGALDRSTWEVRRALAELRGTLFELSQGDDEPEAPTAPLARYVEDVVKRWRLPARVAVKGDLNAVAPRVLAVAYSVIREGLTNAAKHAAGSNVTVTLSASDNELTVTVADSGRGFSRDDENAARAANHFGLNMLRARVHDVGGTLDVQSRSGRGARLIAHLPMRTEPR